MNSRLSGIGSTLWHLGAPIALGIWLLIVIFSIKAGASAIERQCMLKHEKAHCCGWSQNHPGAVPDYKCGTLMPSKQYTKCPPIKVIIQSSTANWNACGAEACAMVSTKLCIIYLPSF